MPTLTHKINQRVAAQTYAELTTIAHDCALSENGHIINGGFDHVLRLLLERYKQTTVSTVSTEQLFPLMGLTTDEAEYVFDVIEKTKTDIAKELRTGFLARIKSLDKYHDRLSVIDLDNPAERKRRLGAGEKALEQIVAQLMAENDAATEDTDKVYLSSGVLKAVARVGKTTVAEFHRNNHALFDTHHSHHGWHDVRAGQRHNQMVSRKYARLLVEKV